MALSGTNSWLIGNQFYIDYRWSATQDTVTNTTVYTYTYSVRAYLSTAIVITSLFAGFNLSRGSESYGASLTGLNNYTLQPSTSKIMLSGTKSFTQTVSLPTDQITFSVTGYAISGTNNVGYQIGTAASAQASTTTYSATLDAMPVPSTISSFPDFLANASVTIAIDRTSTSCTHDLTFKIGNTAIKTVTGVAASATVSFTAAEQNAIYACIPNAASSAITVFCQTKNPVGNVGAASSATATVSIPDTIVPTVTSITGAELVSLVSTKVGAYVKSLSNIRLTINGAAGVQGSTIVGYAISYQGITYNNSTIDTGIINWSGSLTVTATVTDSRGRTASKTLALTALDYSPPAITTFTVNRCTSASVLDLMGTYILINRAGTTTSLNSKNNFTYTIYTKLKNATDWGTAVATGTSAVGTVAMSGTNLLNTYLIDKAYDVRMDFADYFNVASIFFTVSTAQVVMSLGQTGVGIGKVWEAGALDVSGNVNIVGNINNVGDAVIAGMVDALTPNGGTTGGLRIRGNSVTGKAYLQITDAAAASQWGYFEFVPGGIIKWMGNTIWHAGNDGAGSGSNTDMLDGYHAYDFLRDMKRTLSVTDLNDHNFPVPYVCSTNYGASIGLPFEWAHIMYFRHIDNNGYGTQLAIDLANGTNRIYIRASIGTTYLSWRPLTDSYGTTVPTSLMEGEVYHMYA